MKVKFVPQNIEVEATPDKTLLQIATEKGIEIKSICKGVPSCAECRVRIVDGDGNVLPPGKAELSLIGTSYYIDSRRLSCQVHCYGDVTVDLTEQIERAENQTKKVRGFRVSKQQESKAVQDTMILSEKIEPDQHGGGKHEQGQRQHSQGQQQGQQSKPKQDQPNRQNNRPQQQGGGQKSDQQNKQHNRPQQQNKQHQQNKQQNKPQQQQARPPKKDSDQAGKDQTKKN